jgi:hypothetical protein
VGQASNVTVSSLSGDKKLLCTMNRAVGGNSGDGGDPSPGVLRSGCRRWGGFVYNGTCLWRGQSKAKPQARNAVSTVGFCRSVMPSTKRSETKHRASGFAFAFAPVRRDDPGHFGSARWTGAPGLPAAVCELSTRSAAESPSRSGRCERIAVSRRSFGARGRAVPSLRRGRSWNGAAAVLRRLCVFRFRPQQVPRERNGAVLPGPE